MTTQLRGAVALTVGLAASSAAAHGARPSVYDIVDTDGVVTGLATTFGPIRADDHGVLRWACTATVPASTTGYLFSPDAIIATTTRGVWSSADGGCSFSPAEGVLDGRVISELRRDGGSAYAVTADIGEPNGVYRSSDHGATWERYGPAIDAALFGLDVLDGRLVVAALSEEHGWQVHEWEAAGPARSVQLPEGLLDVEVWFAGDDIWVGDVSPNSSALFRLAADGLEPWGDAVEGVITDVAIDDGGVLVATDTNTLYRATPDTLAAIDDPGACFASLSDGTTVRCGTTDGGVAVYGGRVGATSNALTFADVRPAACVAEPEHACAPVAEFAAGFLGADTTPGSSAASGCAASPGPRGTPWIAWAALLGVAWRARPAIGRRPSS